MIDNTVPNSTYLTTVQYDIVRYYEFLTYLKDNGLVDPNATPYGRELEQIVSRVVFGIGDDTLVTRCVITNTTVEGGPETFRVKVEMAPGNYFVWEEVKNDIPGFISKPKKGRVIDPNNRTPSPAVSERSFTGDKFIGDATNSWWKPGVYDGTRKDYFDWNGTRREAPPSQPEQANSPDSIFVTSRTTQRPPSYFIKDHVTALDKADMFASRPPPTPIIPPTVAPPPYNQSAPISLHQTQESQSSTTTMHSLGHAKKEARQQWTQTEQQITDNTHQRMQQTLQLSHSSTSTLQVNVGSQSSVSTTSVLVEREARAAIRTAVQPSLALRNEIPRIDEFSPPTPTKSLPTNQETDAYESDDPETRDRLKTAAAERRYNATRMKGNTGAEGDQGGINGAGSSSSDLPMNGLMNGHDVTNNGYNSNHSDTSSANNVRYQSITPTQSFPSSSPRPMLLVNGYHKAASNQPSVYIEELRRFSPLRQSMIYNLPFHQTPSRVEFTASILYLCGNRYLSSLLFPPKKSEIPWDISFNHRSYGVPSNLILSDGKRKGVGMKKLSSSKRVDEYDEADTKLLMLVIPREKYTSEILYGCATGARKDGVLYGRPSHSISHGNINGIVENSNGHNSLIASDVDHDSDRLSTVSKAQTNSLSKNLEVILIPSLNKKLYSGIGRGIRDFLQDVLDMEIGDENGYTSGNGSNRSDSDDEKSPLEELMKRRYSDEDVGRLVCGSHRTNVLLMGLRLA